MRVLVAISTCAKYELDGKNQAFRNTCMKEAAKFPELTCKFFIGDGTPITEDSTALQQTFNENWRQWTTRFPSSPSVWEKKDVPPAPLPRGFVAKPDTVLIPIPDDYKHMSYKTRESLRWAAGQDYDFVFRCCCDTYIDFQRLVLSGFENHEYVAGGILQPNNYGIGGPGYWLGRSAVQHVINSPVTDWAEDRWVGGVLYKKGIAVHVDRRYVNYPQRPSRNNDFITSHIALMPVPYDVRIMYRLYEERFR
jgi:hypothetical protein